MDSDDDIQLPPPRPAITLDDSDDDLPPPAALQTNKPQQTTTAPMKGITPANNGNGVSKTGNGSPGKNGISTGNAQQLLQSPGDSKAKVIPAKVYKEGFLLKQQPSWPYSNQKRYCVLKNCKLYYFDSQESMKEGRPQGVIGLNNAKLVDPGNDAKLPSSFGIHVEGERPAEGSTTNGNGNNQNGHNTNNSNKKQRTFIFSVMHAHELGEWRAAIQAVVGDTVGDEEDTHWFEKMVQDPISLHVKRVEMTAISGGVESTSNDIVTLNSSISNNNNNNNNNNTTDVEISSWEFLSSDTRLRKPGSTHHEKQYVLDITNLNFPARKQQQQKQHQHQDEEEEKKNTSKHLNSTVGVPRTLLDYLLQGIPAAGHKCRDMRGSAINTESGDVLLRSLLLPPEPVIHPGSQYMERRRRYSAGKEEEVEREEDYKGINVQLKQEEEEEKEERFATVPLLQRHGRRLTL